METVAAKLPPALVKAIDALVRNGEFPNRSDALRAAVRRFVEGGGASGAMEPAGALGAETVEEHQSLMRRIARDPRYRNRWVAVVGDRVVDSDDDMDVLVRRALGRGEEPIRIGLATVDGRLPVARMPGVRVRRA